MGGDVKLSIPHDPMAGKPATGGMGTDANADRGVTVTACVRGCPPTVADTVPLATIGPDQPDPVVGPVIEKVAFPSSDCPENDHCVTEPPVTVHVIELPRVRLAGEQESAGGGGGAPGSSKIGGAAKSPTITTRVHSVLSPVETCREPKICE